MTATILVVDDEPDLEALVLQKFRRQIRDGAVTFVFAHDGIEALAVDRAASACRHGGVRHQHAADGRPVAAAEAAGGRGQEIDHHRLGLWRHEQHPHRDEPRRLRFPDQADRFRRSRNDHRQDHPSCRDDARGAPPPGSRPSARTPRCRGIFRRRSPAGLPRVGDSDGMEVHWREVATIFTDITGFTSLVETAAPEVLGALLNEYVGGMTDVVFAHEGTVAKIIGDAIQVLFNAPGDQPDYAARAIACAHDLDVWARGVSRALEGEGRQFRRHAHRRSRRSGAGRQFRRQPFLRLHRLWRHHQHRSAARGRQQVSRHPHLRQRRGRRGRRRISGAGRSAT